MKNIQHKITFAERHINFYNMLVEIKGDRLNGIKRTMAHYFAKYHVGKMRSCFFDGIENENITFEFALSLLKKIMEYNNKEPNGNDIESAIKFLEKNGYSITKK